MGPDLAPHQKVALNKLRNGSILCGGVGVGKTRTALAYYLNNEYYESLYVITTAKKRDSLDWESEAAPLGIGKSDGTSLAGVMTVDSWNNIGKYEDVEDAFFIFDEQRLVGSGAWVKSFLKIAKHNNWIMLSATPGDTWLDYIPVFVANGYYRNRTDFKQQHVVYNTFSKFPKVDRYIGVSRLMRHRDAILVDMPYQRHTTRHVEDYLVQYDENLYNRVVKKRWHVYENRPLRDVTEYYGVMRKVVNSDASRLEAVRTLITQHRKLIVFYSFDYELEILRTLADWKVEDDGQSGEPCKDDDEEGTWEHSKIESKKNSPSNYNNTSGVNESPSFAIAEWNGHKHEPIPKTDYWVYLVQYRAGSEGWNCTETDAMVFYSLTYSYRDYEQSQGRIDRLNTPYEDLWYYVFRSKAQIDTAIWKSLKRKKSFNEKKTGFHNLDSW